MKETTYVIFEPAHRRMLEEYLSAHPGEYSVVTLDREVEYALEEKGIAFISARELRSPDPLQRMRFVEKLVEDVFRSDTLAFFSYRDIKLGSVFTFVMREYLNLLLYYASIYMALARSHPGQSWVLFAPTGAPPRSGGPLSTPVFRVIVSAAQLVAEHNQIELHIVGEMREQPPAAGSVRLSLERKLFGSLVGLNTMRMRLRRSKPLRVVVSDSWDHTRLWAGELPESEFHFVERREIQATPWKQILQHRMRFGGLEQYAGGSHERDAAIAELQRQWRQRRGSVTIESFDSLLITETVCEALDTIIDSQLLQTCERIDGAYALLSHMQPHAVVVRTSIGGQTQYMVLALVAQRLGIACVELQHGLEFLAPGSISGDHTAQYLALYGPQIIEEFTRRGYNAERLISIGSPRFDAYEAEGKNSHEAAMLIGPDIYPAAGLDSYDCEDYIAGFFAALPANAPSIIKLRGSVRFPFFKAMVERAAHDHIYKIETRPLPQVLRKASTVVSCYSTSILEAMQCDIPVVQLALCPVERAMGHYHFDPYIAAHAYTIAESAEELKAALAELGKTEMRDARLAATHEYLVEHFCFDGKASERFAALLRRFAAEAKKRTISS